MDEDSAGNKLDEVGFCGDISDELGDLLQEPKRKNEDDGFDSGNYSEANDGFSNTIRIISIGSPGVKRRTTTNPEFKTEEYLYSPISSVENICSPLATSTPIPAKPSSSTDSSSSSTSSHLSPYLQSLLANFNTLYKQKLKDAEKMAEDNSPDSLELKYAVMEEWVRDLNEQNAVLIETVDEMEKEAEEKIQLLQGKVHNSAQLLLEHMSVIQEYEKQAQDFLINRKETEQHLELFYAEADELLKKKKTLENKLEIVEKEHASLIKLITRIRDWGTWDIDGLELGPKTYKQLFDLYPSLPGSEVQTVFTKERARQVMEKEKQLKFIDAQFHKLQEDEMMNHEKNLEKEKLIADLQKENVELHSKISALEIENQDYRRRLKETQGFLTQALEKSNRETSTTEAEFKELVNDMKELKAELHAAKIERQTALLEATALKTEMDNGLTDLVEMKNLLLTLRNESETSREHINKILEKQKKMADIEEQVQFYQEKYIDATRLLSSKAVTIDSLQEQIDALYQKVKTLESSPFGPKSITTAIHSPKIPCSARTPIQRYQSRLDSTSLEIAAKALDKSAAALRVAKGHTLQNESEPTTKDSNKTISKCSSEKRTWNQNFSNKSSLNVNLRSSPPEFLPKVNRSKSRDGLITAPKRIFHSINNEESTHKPHTSRKQIPKTGIETLRGETSFSNTKDVHRTKKRDSIQELEYKGRGKYLQDVNEENIHNEREVVQCNEKKSSVESNNTTKITKYFTERFGLCSRESEKNEGKGEGTKVTPELKLPPILDSTSKTHTSILEKREIKSQKLPRLVYQDQGSPSRQMNARKVKAKQKGRRTKSKDSKNASENLVRVNVKSSKKLTTVHPGDSAKVKVRGRHRQRYRHTKKAENGGGDDYLEIMKTVKYLSGSGVSLSTANEKLIEKRSPECIKNPDEILASLPEQSQDLVVQNWILNSTRNYTNSAKPLNESFEVEKKMTMGKQRFTQNISLNP